MTVGCLYDNSNCPMSQFLSSFLSRTTEKTSENGFTREVFFGGEGQQILMIAMILRKQSGEWSANFFGAKLLATVPFIVSCKTWLHSLAVILVLGDMVGLELISISQGRKSSVIMKSAPYNSKALCGEEVTWLEMIFTNAVHKKVFISNTFPQSLLYLCCRCGQQSGITPTVTFRVILPLARETAKSQSSSFFSLFVLANGGFTLYP